MTAESPSTARSEAWTYGLLGGVVSMPLTVGAYWLSGMGNDFSLNLVFVGGLLAGYLVEARDVAADSDAAGLRAGVVGALPGVVWLVSDRLLPVRGADATLPGGFEAAISALAVLFGLGFGAVVGLLGGAIGGWLARKVRGRG